MPKISTRVTFDKATVVAKIKAANDKALTVMGNQALKDSNIFVPHDQGYLEASGIMDSDTHAQDGKFILRWDEPYARYQWFAKVMHGSPKSRSYGPEELSYTKSLAHKEWAKHAREVYGDDWKKVYQDALRKELSG